jgi:hypothetical protein
MISFNNNLQSSPISSSEGDKLILKIKPTCTIFLSMFISFLYMFRATMCPSSEEITV